ncbi:MAG TPA: tetratricopeptide repeat protein [Acidobacteriota bacterium]|jgi:tetratricopeptide (TPR) repeat protein
MRGIFVLVMMFFFSVLAEAQSSRAGVKAPLSQESEAQYHFMQARLAEAIGDFTTALAEYEAALKADPKNAQLMAEYAASLAGMDRYEEALQKAKKAIEIDSSNVDAHLLLAEMNFRLAGRDSSARTAAIAEYEAVLKLDPENPSALSALGRYYIRASQYAKAEQLLDALSKIQPDDGEAIFLLSVAQAEQEKFEAALANVKRVLEFNPSNVPVLLLQGNIYERLRDIEKAIATYQQVLSFRPDESEAKKRLAALLAEKGETKDATQILEDLVKRNPFDSSVLLELGKAQREQKKFGEAIASFRSAAKTDPDNVEVSYWLAATLGDTGQREEAVAILKNVLEKHDAADPAKQRRRLPILLQMGTIQQDDAQYDAAVSTFQQLLRSYPDDFRAYLYLTHAYKLKKDWSRAAETISRGRQKFPDEGSLAIAEAQIVAQQKGVPEGLKLLDALIAKNLSKAEHDEALMLPLKLNRVQILFEHHSYEQAENQLQALLKEYPDNEQVLFQLGAVYERQKKFDKAEQLFRRLLDKNPKNAGVLNYLGYMWADRGENLQQALEYIKKAVEMDPFNGAYLDSLGWVQFKLRDFDLAKANLNKAAKIVRNDPTIHEHLGDLYERLGNYQEALQAYSLSLANQTDAEDSDKVKQKVKKLQKLTKK